MYVFLLFLPFEGEVMIHAPSKMNMEPENASLERQHIYKTPILRFRVNEFSGV